MPHPAPTRTQRPNILGYPGLVTASLVAALGLLAGGIVLTQTQLRNELRTQLANRDAQVLAAILQKQFSTPSDTGDQDPLPALLEALILPELPGVWDVQLYDASGRATLNLLHDVRAEPPSPAQFATITQATADLDTRESQTGLPVAAEFRGSGSDAHLNVLLPVITGPSKGQDERNLTLAAFTLDGSSLASEFVRLDRTLQRRSWLVFGLLGAAMLGALGFSFRRLIRAQQLLQQRTLGLEAANRELSLAARTSAVGAVTAHLVHGLKNPLAGLQQFVQATESGGGETDRADAAATARRMKSMIDDVVRVLRDEQGIAAFELTATELLSHVAQRLRNAAQERGIRLRCGTDLTTSLSNRSANLTALILENLLTNALQAMSDGGEISVTATLEGDEILFRVRDTGPGMPASVRNRIFQPGVTTKAGGTGLGLAISQQLARSIDGELCLAESDDKGTVFSLRVPASQPVPFNFK